MTDLIQFLTMSGKQQRSVASVNRLLCNLKAIAGDKVHTVHCRQQKQEIKMRLAFIVPGPSAQISDVIPICKYSTTAWLELRCFCNQNTDTLYYTTPLACQMKLT